MSASKSPSREAAQGSYDWFDVAGGKKVKLRTTDLAKILRKRHRDWKEVLGPIMRGEMELPDWMVVPIQVNYPQAEWKGLPRETGTRNVKKRGPDIQKLWDKLIEAIWKSSKLMGSDVGDMYVNMPASREQADDEWEFENYLQNASADVAMGFEYSLAGQAEKLYDRFEEALKTGVYQDLSAWGERWNLREKKEELKHIYAEAWHEGMLQAWRRLKKNKREMARLNAMRANFYKRASPRRVATRWARAQK